MLKQERQEYILHQLNLHNKVLCADLSSKMGVSDDTVRRDLQELSQEGKLIKVHGGALSKSFHTAFDREMVYNIEHKNMEYHHNPLIHQCLQLLQLDRDCLPTHHHQRSFLVHKLQLHLHWPEERRALRLVVPK